MIVIEASFASLISYLAGAFPLLGITDLGINGPSLIAYLINFVLLLGILTFFAYKPLLRVLDQRSERIRESLEAADRAREEAASSQQVIEDQLNEARREGQRLQCRINRLPMKSSILDLIGASSGMPGNLDSVGPALSVPNNDGSAFMKSVRGASGRN